jgi:DNA invertase Pin-like site-specific DNA recombinase
MSVKLVAYLRVSTRKQGQSGLGLEGQQAAIRAYAQLEGTDIIAEYVEVESGKRNDRPALANALAFAKRMKAVLIVAKMDRLSRNVAFLSRMMESGVEFRAVDNPSANKLMIHILAAVAEEEARAISKRTRDALQAAKARGTLLGSARPGHWNGREQARKEGAMKAAKASAKVRSSAAKEAYSDLMPIIRKLQQEGLTLRAIASKLNSEGEQTRRGKPLTAMTIHRIIKREG